uniref:Uncharacterized protein n=1 Tax=Hyaloperonospora arabidopsidis (strain Emoy2) TaxID=559515 RepID=M4BW82_HYAAE
MYAGRKRSSSNKYALKIFCLLRTRKQPENACRNLSSRRYHTSTSSYRKAKQFYTTKLTRPSVSCWTSTAICVQAPQSTRKPRFLHNEADKVAFFFLDRISGRSISVCGFSGFSGYTYYFTDMFTTLQYIFNNYY